ncbi:MAG: ribosomal protein L7/L12 [Phycisphaeraceae bacterium]|nr:ribosomal protein L7/L12 [Phycisphaeraceae bacterium]
MFNFLPQQTDPALIRRVDRIEKKLDLLLTRAGIELPEDNLDEVRELARRGDKIAAIKLYREITGAGLAEAKSAVESL